MSKVPVAINQVGRPVVKNTPDRSITKKLKPISPQKAPRQNTVLIVSELFGILMRRFARFMNDMRC